jgi:Sporulation and spore germination
MTSGRILHRTLRALAVGSTLVVTLGLAAGPASAAPTSATTTLTAPRLAAVRAAHQIGYDRVVFEFTGQGPTSATVTYVNRLVADASGLPVPVSARAILQVTMRGVDAHTATGGATVPTRVAYAIPNVITTVKSGDFEGVVTYGIGLAVKTSIHTHWLTAPRRLVIDIATPFRTVERQVYFADTHKITANVNPPVTAVRRLVPAAAPAAGVLDRLYAGPTPTEQARGLTMVASLSTGWTKLAISSDRVARVQLTGQCSSGGSAVITVAGQIFPTLKQFPTVRWVTIYDPQGATEYPGGHRDSIPFCLEP